MKIDNLTLSSPELTVGELCEKIVVGDSPVRRSAHVGNQPPNELVLMTAAPPGVDILLVDTIQGNDNFYQGSPPKVIRLKEKEPIPLCTKKAASGSVVGSVAVDSSCLPKNFDLVCAPIPGESLANFHNRAIGMLDLNNRPSTMLEFFTQHKELFNACMQTACNTGEVTRVVDQNGKIATVPVNRLQDFGIFGLHDETSHDQGAMIPLNAMMALDMAISADLGSEKTTHLGGRHMIQYTKDVQRMKAVAGILAKTLAEVGSKASGHFYEVVDITGLANLVSHDTHASQHQLLKDPSAVIQLDAFEERPCSL